MINQVAHTNTKARHWDWLYKVSSAAALTVGGLLLAAMIDLALMILHPDIKSDWLAPFQNNWLLIIFKLHAGFKGVQLNLLYQLNLLDIVILALIATMHIGLYVALPRTSKAWSMIALAQPILGWGLFIVTKSAGRSSVMGAEFIISVVMLRSELFPKYIAYTGILSGLFLFAGDIGASLAPSIILANLMGVGYALLVAWLFLVSQRLFQLGKRK